MELNPQVDQKDEASVKDDGAHLASGKRRLSKKLTDRIKDIAENDQRTEGEMVPSKVSPYLIDLDKKMKLLDSLFEQFNASLEHENHYNLSYSYYEHIKSQSINTHCIASFDFLIRVSKLWSLSRSVTIHGLHLFHRTLSICDLTCPENYPKEKYPIDLWIRLQELVYVCLVIAQKSYARRNSFTFSNILSWLKYSEEYSMEGFKRTELDILDGLKWSVTSPDINTYCDEIIDLGILNQNQISMFNTLIDVAMFYPRCQIFAQRDIVKAALYLVFTKCLRAEDCATLYNKLLESSPELETCVYVLAEMWNFTTTTNLYFQKTHRYVFGRYGVLYPKLGSK